VAQGKTAIFSYLYAIALVGDATVEFALQGLQARWPGVGTPTALPRLGRDRCIRRGFAESDDSYAGRLPAWLDDWRRAGNPFGLMHAVRDYLSPARPLLRIVNASGTWYTLHPDDTEEVVQTWPALNWDWDGDASKPTRFWLVIYSDAGPWTPGTSYDDGNPWDGGATFGTSATAEQVATLRAIVRDFKSAGDRCSHIIVAFDPTSFAPTAAPGDPGMPDGTWGHWSKNVGGVQVPARLGSAEYWDGV
jgi:hypothetical protein